MTDRLTMNKLFLLTCTCTWLSGTAAVPKCKSTRGSSFIVTKTQRKRVGVVEAVGPFPAEGDPVAPTLMDAERMVRAKLLQANMSQCTPPAGETCMCDWNEKYPCYGPYNGGCTCWSYTSRESCESISGSFCERPATCAVEHCELCASTTACSRCIEGYMVVDGQCTQRPTDDDSVWLKVHNIFRCMHGSPAVAWSAAAASSAESHVSKLSTLIHSDSYSEAPPAGPAGENLARGYSSPEAAAWAWYREVEDCLSLPGCQTGIDNAAVGHFTAMIWAGGKEIGCAHNPSSGIHICRYRGDDQLNKNTPNMKGHYTEMVPAKVKDVATCIAEVEGTFAKTTPTSTSVATSTTSSISTTTTTLITSTSVLTDAFTAADGENGRACRGETACDNAAGHYTVFFGVTSIQDCKAMCVSEPKCVGIEHNRGGRCEVWTRSGGIQATSSVSGYQCLRYSARMPKFEAVNGGCNQACRGATSSDNSNGYFNVFHGLSSEECKAKCSSVPACKGIEYNKGGRCEVWTRHGGIQSSTYVKGYTCLRVSSSGEFTTSTTVAVTTSLAITDGTSSLPVCEAPPEASRGHCESCFHSAQCPQGYYCCPYMRKCVDSSTTPCSYPIANCQSPLCYDSACDKASGCSCTSCTNVGPGKYYGWLTWANLKNSNGRGVEATCRES